MSKTNNSIHEFDYSLISEYFSKLQRQGPGSAEVTIKAAGFIETLSSDSHIADIGCGTGGQTMVLAQHILGNITCIDLFPTFIKLLNKNASNQQLGQRIKGIVSSMDDLPFTTEELDLIWSEGAIYNIGFKRGLKNWRKFLKPGGHIAVSEACWLTNTRPIELENFWIDAYPEIDTIANKVAQVQDEGYLPIATFVLPESCWTEHFYVPQVEVQKKFLKEHPNNETVKNFIANQQYEAELYYKYKKYYGYVFFIGKKL